MGIFYNLGRKAGPKIRKGQWIWHSLTGSTGDAIAAEYRVGCDIAAALRMEVPCDQSSGDAVFIQKIGNKLSKRVANKLRMFNFEIITDGPPNAFALAGGFIFVTRSLLELCDRDEDEMAFIIAHEMGHIIRGHSMDRLVSSTAFSVLSKRLPGVGAIGAWLKGTGLKLLESAYSQQNEFTADELGTKLAIAGGYDENACERLLYRLARTSTGPDDESLAKYFATHPPFNERIANVRKTINEAAPKQLKPLPNDKTDNE
ncbi:MAG: M48 family metalloprotease [Planctomycetes bacterium]|nr:M48 family metalloprotease [Planctomycetota bacterium]